MLGSLLKPMSKAFKPPVVIVPTIEESNVVTAAAKSDPDAQPLTASQLKVMVPLRALWGRPKFEK
jgi:hypothetical protein